MGDIGKLGEAGREWLCEFGIWISRHSPPPTDSAESGRQSRVNSLKSHCSYVREQYVSV